MVNPSAPITLRRLERRVACPGPADLLVRCPRTGRPMEVQRCASCRHYHGLWFELAGQCSLKCDCHG